ncbi:MAG: phosphonate ABC transporter, permease protein PhnE [Comamonadaceae bacterium]|nr:MAG: phosphonate ABC transporter, permease protein PhnE [Comamonadaceae bacterium]
MTTLNTMGVAYAQAVVAKRRQLWLGLLVLGVCVLFSGHITEISLSKFFNNIGAFTSYIDRISHLENGHWVVSDPVEWFWGWKKWLALMGETLLMAYVGTLLGAFAALMLCFLASKNMTQSTWVVFTTRRLLEFSRTVPEMVFALIFVVAFSLGPLPGILALAIHTTGALGKLFAEVVENVDMKPVEGVIATGGGWLHKVRFAVLPQVASNFASYALLRFEINVRSAAVLGFVGAGGIGQTLLEVIRKFYYADVSALLVLIIATVMLIDTITERVRHRLLGQESAP